MASIEMDMCRTYIQGSKFEITTLIDERAAAARVVQNLEEEFFAVL